MQVMIAIGIVAALVVLAGWAFWRVPAGRARGFGDIAAAVQRWVRPGVSVQAHVFQSANAEKLAARKSGLKLAALGVGLFVAGVGLTNLSYALAGGRYIIPSGLFVAGVFALGVGMSRVLTGR
jgi:hypothetical protein